ncbi:hypothetical protein RS9916_34412 [Synechococcus sp. RS9916]|nr:hypothetical protein RS9916_34412 [Synechococcus sp. RS9916]
MRPQAQSHSRTGDAENASKETSAIRPSRRTHQNRTFSTGEALTGLFRPLTVENLCKAKGRSVGKSIKAV